MICSMALQHPKCLLLGAAALELLPALPLDCVSWRPGRLWGWGGGVGGVNGGELGVDTEICCNDTNQYSSFLTFAFLRAYDPGCDAPGPSHHSDRSITETDTLDWTA